MRIKIPESVVKKASSFADSVISTVDYSDSNQTRQRKIRDDHFISKIGEEAVYRCFKLFTDAVSKPDYKIYSGSKKSWESDLRVEDIPIAVKTQKKSSAEKYGLSWTFQDSPVRHDPILDEPEAWVCFVECDDTAEYKCTVYPPNQMMDLIFREPKLSHLKGKKKVIYATTVR